MVTMRHLHLLAPWLLPCVSAAVKPTDFNWTTITPSKSLQYTPCYGEFKCARLEVPLDWLDTANNDTVALAVIARPATVNVTDPSFGGTVIGNPGGPGGSGVEFMLLSGKHMQYTLDGAKHYEVLSFDPRGIGYTTPNADCFRNEEARQLFAAESRLVVATDQGGGDLTRKLGLGRAFGQLCQDDDGLDGNKNIRKFLSTPSVVRDMVQLVDLIEAERNGTDGYKGPEPGKAPRLKFWGFSYGTFLGSYFSAMFPGRVERMLLDGNGNITDYINGDWLNLLESEDVVNDFYESCFNAGSECPLTDKHDKKWEDLRSRVSSFIDKLTRTPASYVSKSRPISLTGADVRNAIINPLYQPLTGYPVVSSILASAMAGNFTPLYSSMSILKPELPPVPQLSGGDIGTYTWETDALAAVACGDGPDKSSLHISTSREYLDKLVDMSPTFANYWSDLHVRCRGWKVRPKYTFSGPFTTPEADPRGVEGKPSAPILFASSRLDPVTPKRYAYSMAELHPGSTVVLLDAVGHTSFVMPSKCLKSHIEKYFEAGEMPKNGTMCKGDCEPFKECKLPWE